MVIMAGDTLTILHFNDVYNIEGYEKEPVGGAARLANLVKSQADSKPLVLFSGDCFNPSMMSTVTRGKQMVPVLNAIGVAASCVGNHDLDFGVDHFISLSKQCKFPWLLANISDSKAGRLLGDAVPTTMLEWNGWKVGLVGLGEEDWLATLGSVDMELLTYNDFVEEGRRYARQLREEGADLVVALTHMRAPNDIKLLEEAAEIDLVLGGHDHDYLVQEGAAHGNLLVKSGTDFKDLTRVEIRKVEDGPRAVKLSWTRKPVTREVPEDPAVAKLVKDFEGVMGAKMDKVIGYTLVDLDGCFSAVRTGETNLGNFVCDVWMRASQAEAVVLNSGTLRSDMIHSKGPLKVKDLVAILPMLDATVLLACPGSSLLAALENGVSQYPEKEGRFPQVAGIRFSFDPSKPAGQRVVPGSVHVGGRPLDLRRSYKVATKAYLADGRDGYDCFEPCKRLVDAEVGVLLPTAIRNHFRALQVLSGLKTKEAVKATAHHWSRLTRRRTGEDASAALAEQVTTEGPCVFDPVSRQYVISPVVEGRIVCMQGGAA